jgi:hypothetical protein
MLYGVNGIPLVYVILENEVPEEGRESGYDVKTECLSGSGHQE